MNESLTDSALAPVGKVDVAPTGHGPLDGVTIAVKDLYDVAGYVTAAGNPTLAVGRAATDHAMAVNKLLAAGSRVIAKTATDELAMGMFGVNTHFGTPINPEAPDRVPGGSSSGSATFVASGEAVLGLGTDTGGSIRVPASFCGIHGLRTTHGRIDPTGIRPMAPRFDTVGLLARDSRTLATAFDVLTEQQRQPSRGVTTLVLLTDLLEAVPAQIADITRSVAELWCAVLGYELCEENLCVDLRPEDLVSVFWPLMSRELWLSNGSWVISQTPQLGAGIGERIKEAATVSDDAVAEAEIARQALIDRLGDLLSSGLAILPTTVDAAPPRSSSYDDLMRYRERNLTLVVPASLAGAPQLSIPAAGVFDPALDSSAPLGVSLLGLPGDDEFLLDCGRLIDDHTSGDYAHG